MKISEVTAQDLVDYLRLDDATEIEEKEVEIAIASATDHIKSYTGLNADEIDEHENLTQALFVLVADMFDNRNMQFDKPLYNNKTVQSILNMHCTNLL